MHITRQNDFQDAWCTWWRLRIILLKNLIFESLSHEHHHEIILDVILGLNMYVCDS